MDPAGLGGRRNRQTGHLCHNTVVAHVLSFTKALLEAFDASAEEYQPIGKGTYDCGKLARYLKDVLEGALAAPVFAGNDKEVFEFIQEERTEFGEKIFSFLDSSSDGSVLLMMAGRYIVLSSSSFIVGILDAAFL